MTAHVSVSRADGVQILRLARPEKLNALTGAMYDALCDAFEAGDRDADVRAHVLAGCNGTFTAGNDIADFLATSQGGALAGGVLRFIRLLPQLEKPLIAAVDGKAIGIGTTVLFHCDLVYASETSTFATPFLDLGLIPEAASSLLMPRLMGHPKAFEMLVLGEVYDARRACEAGFVNEVVPSPDVEGRALSAASRLARKPPEALAIARRLLRGDPATIAQRTDEEARLFGERLKSPEAREAFAAFVEKRPPRFGT